MLTKKRITLYFYGLVTIVLFLDQITKYFVVKYSPHIEFKLLTLTSIRNTGAGFGILQGQTFFLGLISLAVTLGLIYYYPKLPRKKIPQLFFALFLGGTIGNMLDRFFRGYVVDFINFSFWPAFNIADSALTIAVIGLIGYYFLEEKKGKNKLT